MIKPDFDFDSEEIVQQPGLGPMTLRSAIFQLPPGPAPAETMLNRQNGGPFFTAAQADALREYFKANPA